MVALATTMLVAKTSTVHASSWRVNNDATKKAHFVDINAAMASEEVHDGDTLYLDPGCSITTTQTVTKQVFIIGTGWDNTYMLSSSLESLYLDIPNIKIEGVICKYFNIRAGNITIERCKFNDLRTANYGGVSNRSNVTIRQCFINKQGGSAISGEGTTSENTSNWIIENSIIYTYWIYECISNLLSPTLTNNIIINSTGDYVLKNMTNAHVTNNIIVGLSNASKAIETSCSGVFTNNVISQDYLSEQNKTGYTLDQILTGDYESYQLTEDSPAKGYATDGGDCGIFGGAYPYVAGGLPYGHPYYTRVVVGSTAHDGKLNVSLKVKMQDE